MRQLAESRQRLLDLRAVREQEVRQLHSIMARQVVEAIGEVEKRQLALMQRQDTLLALCSQLLQERQALRQGPGPGGGCAGAEHGWAAASNAKAESAVADQPAGSGGASSTEADQQPTLDQRRSRQRLPDFAAPPQGPAG